MGSCLPEYLRFQHAAARVAKEQTALLKSIVGANAATEFGRSHGFASIRCVRDFQREVPLRDYEAHQEWITRVAGGVKNVLTREPVRLLEPTGGSSGGPKLVPYSASLQQQFRRGIQAWVAGLFLRNPELLTGSAYWSLSPVNTRVRRTSGGIPIGFEEDAAYLGGRQQQLVNSIMAVPGSVSRSNDMDVFRYLTLFFLVRCRDLRLISVWNPTFLSLLMEHLTRWGEEIAWDLERGTISHGAECVAELLPLRCDQKRALELSAALRTGSMAERHSQLWPRLRLISCWKDGNAASPATALQAQFPLAQMQGKGLLATEGIVSFPVGGLEGSALAVRSHFFEFLPVGPTEETGPPHLAHELEEGRKYLVVMTTGGGLYRYRLGDLVEVTGKFRECPLLRFVGRQEHISDWFGEKLSESHVSQVLHDVCVRNAIAPRFAMLACDTQASPSYVLYIDAESTDNELSHAAQVIDELLCSSFHYQYARKLGQLSPLRVFRVHDAPSRYMAYAISQGQRAGNVKPVALDRRNIWSTVFRGYFLSTPQDPTPKGLGVTDPTLV